MLTREMIARNRMPTGFIYLQVTRGAVKRDHVPPADGPRPTLIITMRAQDVAGLKQRMGKGIAVSTQPDIRWGRCDIKTVQLLPNLMAKQAAKSRRLEAWRTKRAMSPRCFDHRLDRRSRRQLITRDLTNAITGVTRSNASGGAEAQIKVVERKFTVAEAKAAKSLPGCRDCCALVVQIDGRVSRQGVPGSSHPADRRLVCRPLWAKA
jgi:D-alanine transaminase